nr:MAG TPA: hypothetical protein [Caudoviricetes sp.]
MGKSSFLTIIPIIHVARRWCHYDREFNHGRYIV